MLRQSLSLSAVVAQLRELCQEQKTGTLHIMDKGHLLGQIILQQGEITAMIAQKKQGIAALPILLAIRSSDIAFSSGPTSIPRMSLPSTSEILAVLDRTESAAILSDPKSRPYHLSISTATKTVLEQTLKEFIGPVAKMVCTDHFRFATDLEATIDALADEIPNPQAAIQFRERVRQRLG